MGMDLEKASTHLRVLEVTLKATTGDVLELGVGEASTPFLHRICAEQGRRLVSYDNHSDWLQKFESYRSPLHDLKFVSDWREAELERPWAVALIDHRPAGQRRITAARLLDHAEFVIVHDTEPEIDRFYRISRIVHKWKYNYVDSVQKPYSTVFSNTRDPKELEGLR